MSQKSKTVVGSTLLRLCRRTVQSRPCISYTSQVLDAQVQVLRYSTKAQTWLGVRFVPFPGPSSSGDQVLGEHTVPGGLCILITSPVPAAWFPRCARRAPSQVCRVSPLGSWCLAATLLADANCPGSQEDLVSNSEPAHSLVEDAISGANIASHLLALVFARLPLGLWQGEGLVQSRLALLWSLCNPLFCEWARLCLRLELFAESSLSLSYFFSLSLDIPQFGLLSHVSSLRLASGHSGPVLTLSRQPAPPFQPPLCGGGHKHLGYFSAVSCG